MKFFNFHLMPYRHADLDAIEKNGSAWVTYSNKHYDPKKGADTYHEYLDQMEFADTLGFDGVCLNEHHQTAYGLMPIPGVLAGALARSRQARQACDPRPRAAAPQQSADGGGGIRHPRQSYARPFHCGVRQRHRRRVPRHGRQPGVFAGALRGGARRDPARLDRARAVRLRGQALSVRLREPVAAALSVAASADLGALAGLGVHDQVGRGKTLHLCADALAHRRGGALLPDVPRRGQ